MKIRKQPSHEDGHQKALPLLRWAGSKRKLLPHLTEYWSGAHKRYIEPFVGSGALFFALSPKRAILSDLNNDLITTYKEIARRPLEVHKRFAGIPATRNKYEAIRTLISRESDPATFAAQFVYLNRNCFNGIYRTNKQGRFNVPFSNSRTGRTLQEIDFNRTSVLLRRARIVCADFEKVIREEVRSGDFVYLDPPYAKKNGRIFTQYNAQVFGTSDLHRLFELLEVIDSTGATFVLSYADCPDVREFIGSWNVRKLRVLRNVAGFSAHRRTAQELVISNAPDH